MCVAVKFQNYSVNFHCFAHSDTRYSNDVRLNFCFSPLALFFLFYFVIIIKTPDTTQVLLESLATLFYIYIYISDNIIVQYMCARE